MSRIFVMRLVFALSILFALTVTTSAAANFDAANGARNAASSASGESSPSIDRSSGVDGVSDSETPPDASSGPAASASPADDLVDDVTNDQERTVLFRRAFKEVLKLTSLPEVRSGNPAMNRRSGNSGSQMPTPPYMIELYERYRRGEINKRGGNTVRSILSLRGNINGEEMMLFNLSGIGRHEELMHAELHFDRRRKIKFFNRARSADFRLKFFGITSDENLVSPLSLIDLPTRHHGRGWQVQDVTRVVDACRVASQHHLHHLLGVKLQGLNRKAKYVSLPFNKFLRSHSQPFLVIFSNDRDNDTIDKLEASHVTGGVVDESESTNPDMESEIDGVTDELAPPTANKANQQSTNYNGNSRTKILNDTAAPPINSAILKRLSRRSIHDNELPDNSVYTNFVPKTSPGILQSRGRHRSSSRASKTIPYPAAMTFGKNRKKVNAADEQSRQRQNRKLPMAWQDKSPAKLLPVPPRHENDATSDAVGEENNNACRKRKLVVDFADIGWGEWIISPKSFEAHYCAGVCPFPLTKDLKPSNHATIQSIVHAIGIQTNVPCPVCVADNLSSVTLLYFDEDRNVVLKNYPSMTVESCACR